MEACTECGSAYERACQNSCVFDAIEEDENGKLYICPEKCIGCNACIEACKSGKLTNSRHIAGNASGAPEKRQSVCVDRACLSGTICRNSHTGEVAECISGIRL